MPPKSASTILLTTKCSGGCVHCPFTSPKMESLFLSRDNIKKTLNKTKGDLFILSGGEPFEHPEMNDILTDLCDTKHPFRIATGGFVDLTPWIDKLIFLCLHVGTLKGISMGTDVLSMRVSHNKWVPIWENNIRLFSNFKIPYSLTITVDNDLDFARLNLWCWDDIFEGKPEFIYLRYSESHLLEEWISKIRNSFGAILIILDDIHSE